MVARKVADHEPSSAVAANLPVAHEQHLVRKTRSMPVHPGAAAFDGKERARGDARTEAVFLPAAAELADLASYRPRHHLFGVVSDGFLEFNPGLRQASHVDCQNE